MSLISALNIGKTALATHQAAIQVIGNNIANAGNPDYTRQVAQLAPGPDQQTRPGMFVGTGVNLAAVTRQIDEALQSRLRSSISDDSAAQASQQWLGRVEATFNELSDQDLSTRLSTFFNSWSDLANDPANLAKRQVVIQNGASLGDWIQSLRGDLASFDTQIDDRLAEVVKQADSLAQQVADLNSQITTSEGGGKGEASGLRDQRDLALKQLAQLVDIQTIPAEGGQINVFLGSDPLVMGRDNRGLALTPQTVNGQLIQTVIFKRDGDGADLTSGELGALSTFRTQQLEPAISQLDSIAGNLIFELNKLHASGQGTEGFSTVSATNGVNDLSADLNSSDAGLAFSPTSGSFVIHVKQKDTGLTTSALIQVDLDGLNNDDATLTSLAAQLDGIGNISASAAGGKLTISADNSNFQFSFSQDSSGVLAALGINTFFTGKNAADIDVNQLLQDRPALLAASGNGEPTDNSTATAIFNLADASLTPLNGQSLNQAYQAMVSTIATSSAAANNNADAASSIRATLEAQRQSLSGVSMDEEAVNLIQEQRAFQGAARLIAVIDEMMKTVLQMV